MTQQDASDNPNHLPPRGSVGFWQTRRGQVMALGLWLTGLLIVLVALAYFGLPQMRFLILVVYVLTALLFYNARRAYLKLAERLSELRTLNRIGQAVSANLEFDDLVVAIREELGELLDTSGFYLALHDPGSRTISFPVHYEEGQRVAAEPRTFANGPSEYIIRTRQPLVMNERVMEHVAGLGLQAQGRVPRSYAGVPVISRDQVIGVMGLRNYDREYAYTEGDIQLLQTIAAQAAAAIRNAQLYHQSVRQRNELDALHHVSLAASASLELGDVLHLICGEAVSVMPFRKVAILLVDDESSTMRMVESLGLSERFHAEASGIDIRTAQRAEVIRTGQPTIVENIETDPRFVEFRAAARAEGFSAVLDVPLRIGERVIGSLAAYYEAPRSFDPSEIDLMQTLGGQVAVAVENARLFEATRARTRELETLYDASTAITSSLSLKNVLRAVGLSVVQALHTRSCVMLIALEDRRELQPELRLLAGAEGILDDNLGPVDDRPHFLLDDLPAVAAAMHRQSAVVLNRTDDLSEAECRMLEYAAVHSAAVMPLAVRNMLVGLIVTGSPDRMQSYSPGQIRVAEAMANQAAVAIENAILFERTDVELSQRLDEITSLELVAQRMTRRLDLNAVIEQVLQAAAAATGAELAEVALLEEHEQILRIAARANDPGMPLPTEWPITEGVSGRALRTGQTVRLDDVRFDPDYTAARPDVQSELVVPIVMDGQRMGVINLKKTRMGAFNDDHARFVGNLAGHAAIAIQNAQLYEAVQHSRDLLQAILDSSHDGIIMYDMDQRLVMANSRIEYLLNVHLTDFIGERLPSVIRKIVAVTGKEEIYKFEHAQKIARQIKENPTEITRRRFLLNEPTVRAIEEISLPVSGQDGAMLGRMFILRDITQEFELEQFRQELSHMLVHDLRSPLGGVITSVHTSLEEIQENPKPDLDLIATLLGVALSSSRSVLALVEEILDVNKLVSGEMSFNLTEVNLADAAQRTYQTLERQANEADLRIDIAAPPDLLPINADASMIDRVMTNLLDNAIRYTPEGGHIQISVEPSSAVHTVTIADSGEGIPPEHRERIFERFVQVDTTKRKRGSKGSGLGLTFCKLAVEAHGGRIWVDDGPEGGAAFHFTLP